MQPATAVVEVSDFVVTGENRARKTPGGCLQGEGGVGTLSLPPKGIRGKAPENFLI